MRKGNRKAITILSTLQAYAKKIRGNKTDRLTKALNAIDHNLLSAKLHAYGFEKSYLTFFYKQVSKEKTTQLF